MQAGKLRHRVTLQAPVNGTTAGGERVATWTTVQTVWAAVRPASAAEIDVGSKSNMQLTHTVEVRWQDNIFLPERRFLFKGRSLEIVGSLNPAERGWNGIIKCLEVDL